MLVVFDALVRRSPGNVWSEENFFGGEREEWRGCREGLGFEDVLEV
jgi:hypothetical protein